MRRLYAFALIVMLMALTACSKGNYRLKEVKSDTAIITYDYYDDGTLKSITTADEDGNVTMVKELSPEGKLTKVESTASYYPAITITGDLSYTRHDTMVGLEYDSDYYLRPDGQTKMKIQNYPDKKITNVFVYDENGICKGITSDEAGEEYFKVTYEYEYDKNGNPSKCYQVKDGKKTFIEDMVYEKY